MNLIGDFENALVAEAKRREVDGIICGHIHHAALHDRLGIHYVNCGDWLESCTAVGERYGGEFEIIHWAEEKRQERQRARLKPATPPNRNAIAA